MRRRKKIAREAQAKLDYEARVRSEMYWRKWAVVPPGHGLHAMTAQWVMKTYPMYYPVNNPKSAVIITNVS